MSAVATADKCKDTPSSRSRARPRVAGIAGRRPPAARIDRHPQVPSHARRPPILAGQGGDMPDPRPADDPRFTPIMLRKTLVAQGWKDRALARMVRDGVWAKPRHGAYVDGSAWRAADDIGRHEIAARAVLAQANCELVLSHLTAASVWDLSFWDLVPNSVHGTRRDGRCGRSEAGVTQHRGVLLPEDLVIRHRVAGGELDPLGARAADGHGYGAFLVLRQRAAPSQAHDQGTALGALRRDDQVAAQSHHRGRPPAQHRQAGVGR